MGTTLAVFPIAAVVPVAHRCGAEIVIVNAEPTDFDPLAEVVVRAPIGEALPAIVARATGSRPTDRPAMKKGNYLGTEIDEHVVEAVSGRRILRPRERRVLDGRDGHRASAGC